MKNIISPYHKEISRFVLPIPPLRRGIPPITLSEFIAKKLFHVKGSEAIAYFLQVPSYLQIVDDSALLVSELHSHLSDCI